MTQTDSARMAAIHAAAFRHDRPWSAAEINGLLSATNVHAVARPNGFAMIRVVLDEAELLTIAVHPDSQKQGLGTVLLNAATDLASTRGAIRMFLEVAADNAPAVALYASAGWMRIGIRKGYYARSDGPAVDAVMMETALTRGQPGVSQGKSPKTS